LFVTKLSNPDTALWTPWRLDERGEQTAEDGAHVIASFEIGTAL
jgi:hypothetical protein